MKAKPTGTSPPAAGAERYKIITACWIHSKASGTTLLVLLALAKFANAKGECWPSIARLAEMSRVHERTVQRHIRSLETLGEIVVIPCGGRSSRTGGVRSNLYRIVIRGPQDGEDGGSLPPPAGCHPGRAATQTPAPVPPMTPAPVPPEPSVRTVSEPSLSSLAARESGLAKAICDVCAMTATTLTHPERSDVKKAASQLRSVGATPEEVRRRAPIITAGWKAGKLTPRSLVKHWSEGASSARSPKSQVTSVAVLKDRVEQFEITNPGVPVPSPLTMFRVGWPYGPARSNGD